MAKCVGCGLEVNAGILEVATKDTGGIGCLNTGTDQGIYAKLCATNSGLAYDAACVDQNGNPGGLKVSFPPNTDGGTSSPIPLGNCLKTDAIGHVTIKTKVDTCNALQCTVDGLYAPCVQSIHVIDQAGFSTGAFTPTNVSTAGLATFNFEARKNWQVCNTMCCNMQGRLMVEIGGLSIDMSPGFLAKVTVEQSFNGGVSWGGIFPEHIEWLDNRASAPGNPNGGVVRASFPLYHETIWSIIDKGLCNTFTYRYHLQVMSGTGTVDTFGANAGVEFHADYVPTHCDPCPDPTSGPAVGPGFDSTKAMSYVAR